MQKSSQKPKPGEFTLDDLIDRVAASQPKKKGKRLTPRRLHKEIQARAQERAENWGRELPIPADILRDFERDSGLQAGAVGVAGAIAGAVATPVREPRVVCATDYQGTFTGPKFEDVIPAAGMAEVTPFGKAIDDPFEKNAAFRLKLEEALDWSGERCSLADTQLEAGEDAGSWHFETVAKNARSRPGHDFVTWPYLSFADGAWKIARDLVEAARQVRPNLGNEGIAVICLSVQTRQYVAGFFKLFGDSDEARALAGDRATAQWMAELAAFRASELLAKYAAKALDTEAACKPETISGVVEDADTKGENLTKAEGAISSEGLLAETLAGECQLGVLQNVQEAALCSERNTSPEDDQLKPQAPRGKTGRPRGLAPIDGQRVKQIRGDLSQAAFARGFSVDVLQRAEKGFATDNTIRKINKRASTLGRPISL